MDFAYLINFVTSAIHLWLPIVVSVCSLLISLLVYDRDRSNLRVRAVLYETEAKQDSWIDVRATNHGRRITRLRGIVFRDQDGWEMLRHFAKGTSLEEGESIEFRIAVSDCEWADFSDEHSVACRAGVLDSLGRRHWIPGSARLLADLKSLAGIESPPRSFRTYAQAIGTRIRGRGIR